MGGALALSSTSCKGKVDGGGTQLNIKSIKLWEKDVLDANKVAKERLTVSPLATSKSLVIAIENCTDFKVVATVNNKNYEGSTNSGLATIAINDKLPTTDTPLAIVITADGFAKKAINTNVKMEETSVPELSVKLTPQGDPAIEIDSEGQEVEITKTSATLTVSSPRVEMEKLTIDGKDVTLTNKNQYTHQIPNITADKSVTVLITYAFFKDVNRSFNIKKYTDADLPLTLVSAKIFSGDNYAKSKTLTFDSEGKAEVSPENIQYSTVKLEMEFKSPLKERTFEEIRGNRQNPPKEQNDLNGKFAGYVVAEAQGVNETKLTPIPQDSKKYTEELIVGIGSAGFKIKVTAKNDKTKTFDITVKNGTTKQHTATKDGGISANNAIFGTPMLTGTGKHLFLPCYSKGPIFKDNNTSNDSLAKELAYAGKVGVMFRDFDSQPYWLYYNEYKDTDKHEFKRVKAVNGTVQTYKFTRSIFVADPGDQGSLDVMLAWKDAQPFPLFFPYIGEKFKKLEKPHGLFKLEIDNTLNGTEGGKPWPAWLAFRQIYNYRVQTQYYYKQNTNGSTGEADALKICKSPDFIYWEDGEKHSTWLPLLDTNTKFLFAPTPLVDPAKISEIKHTVWSKADNNSGTRWTEDSNIRDVEPAKGEGDNKDSYVLGTKKGGTEKVTFEDNKVYKVEVKVKYSDASNVEDKFLYIIDYTSTNHKLDLLSIGSDLPDTDSHFFGVPMHYGEMRMIDPALIKEMERMPRDILY